MNRKQYKVAYIRYKNNMRRRGMTGFEGILKNKRDYFDWLNIAYKKTVKSFNTYFDQNSNLKTEMALWAREKT